MSVQEIPGMAAETVQAFLPANFFDGIITGVDRSGDNDPPMQLSCPHPFGLPYKKRLALERDQHFIGQTGRPSPCLNNGNYCLVFPVDVSGVMYWRSGQPAGKLLSNPLISRKRRANSPRKKAEILPL